MHLGSFCVCYVWHKISNKGKSNNYHLLPHTRNNAAAAADDCDDFDDARSSKMLQEFAEEYEAYMSSDCVVGSIVRLYSR